MTTNIQCFTKIVKNDFKWGWNLSKIPLLILLALILACTITPFEILHAIILPYTGLMYILMLNVGILWIVYCAIKDPINTPHILILVVTMGLITFGAIGTTLYAFESFNNGIISCISIAFTLCLLPFMHGYIKCKQV